MIEIHFEVNGKTHAVKTHPLRRLLDILREDLCLIGTKEGCGEGECGACSVMMNGDLVNSCLVPAIQLEGARVRTIESLAEGDHVHEVQKAFVESGGAQCGFCTPGMVMASLHLLENCASPDESQIREGLAGNLCRCTGYNKIVDSVKKVADARGSH